MCARARRASGAYGAAKESRRGLGLLMQAFYSWRQAAVALRSRRLRMQRAEQWCRDVHLGRNVLQVCVWGGVGVGWGSLTGPTCQGRDMCKGHTCQ